MRLRRKEGDKGNVNLIKHVANCPVICVPQTITCHSHTQSQDWGKATNMVWEENKHFLGILKHCIDMHNPRSLRVDNSRAAPFSLSPYRVSLFHHCLFCLFSFSLFMFLQLHIPVLPSFVLLSKAVQIRYVQFSSTWRIRHPCLWWSVMALDVRQTW